ncbi:cupin domain-containing protein [Sporosarcina obsidiansis]|uniref:cupin domain-containing protein n=1 Tax=Sporosarcina obsidiansis TaxID=2660748 RepID=UPI001E3B7805|nr:cupin domain-containing protein [Sporosarcina obsidiansis]
MKGLSTMNYQSPHFMNNNFYPPTHILTYYGMYPISLPVPPMYTPIINESPNYSQSATYYSSTDYGPAPFAINIEEATKQNNAFRTALWTGEHLQLTLMSINVGDDIGQEMHPNLDQFIRIEDGKGLVQMGDMKDRLDFQRTVSDDYIFIIPAGKWHNLKNTGNKPLKLYSIYAPPQHPYGTVHVTKADAQEAEKQYE